jgi:uncharacterized protein (TIGR02646 family)
MRKIIKQSEPISLTEHRSMPYADYDNYPDKDKLRESLLNEQGYICCYCMSRITKERIKIEHWKPQSKYTRLQLDYKNLLGACKGNEGARLHKQHCDTKKGQTEITINPTEESQNCESLIIYRSTGEIYSPNDSINDDLDKTLNLNLDFLVTKRKNELDLIFEYLEKKFPDRIWDQIYLQELINQLSAKN